jgi:phosphoglycerol transferase MdoB-like AlkP superfamily enzyme
MLSFMLSEINNFKKPFFSTCYNISTHYPFDLPLKEKELKAKAGYTEPMKSMLYYDKCLEGFFDAASKKDWYNNTVFIFCSDHWAFPDQENLNVALGQDFHIPIIIFDPSKPVKKVDSRTASQFDIVNTILSIAGTKDSIISYGNNLLVPPVTNEMHCVFSKKSRDTYYVTNVDYILAFNTVTGKAESCFNFKKDPERKNNILNDPFEKKTADSMTVFVKAFLQQSSMHYNNLTNP